MLTYGANWTPLYNERASIVLTLYTVSPRLDSSPKLSPWWMGISRWCPRFGRVHLLTPTPSLRRT
ncbi:hypothetical protein RSAG8_03594, partial [Rhizoctonia solani AG-8 WAC10335]